VIYVMERSLADRFRNSLVHGHSRFLYARWKEGIAGAREIRRLMALPGMSAMGR